MPDIKPASHPVATPAKKETSHTSQTSLASPSSRRSVFGHALDGSQQLDILEEQVFANATMPAKDQPLVTATEHDKKPPEGSPGAQGASAIGED